MQFVPRLQMKDKLQHYYCKFNFNFFEPIKLEFIYSNNTFAHWYNELNTVAKRHTDDSARSCSLHVSWNLYYVSK